MMAVFAGRLLLSAVALIFISRLYGSLKVHNLGKYGYSVNLCKVVVCLYLCIEDFYKQEDEV